MKLIIFSLFILSISAYSNIKGPCGADNRTMTQDSRIGRALRLNEDIKGCSAFLIGKSCMISAAHCVDKLETIQFQVPMSNPQGEIQHPALEDQYSVDKASIVNGSLSTGVRNDYAVFRTLKNSKTGKFAGEVQGSFKLNFKNFRKGDDIIIRGYGYNHSRIPEEFNIQKSDTGPIKKIKGIKVYYDAFTSNGNSGSPIIHKNTDEVIGVHTNGGGCFNGRRGNHGYLLRSNSDFANAVKDCLNHE